MILVRVMTVGFTLRNHIRIRSNMPTPAPVITDWTQSLANRVNTARKTNMNTSATKKRTSHNALELKISGIGCDSAAQERSW